MPDQTASGLASGLNVGSAVAQGVIGGVQLFTSLADEKKKERELSQLKDPFFNIQNEFYQNRNLAAEQAQGGLPTASKDYLTGESQRGLSAGISGVLQSGGSPNDINKLFDTYNKSIDRTAAQDAEMHQKNIDYFINANKDLAGEKIKQWAINKYQPIEQKRKALSESIAADKQNAYGGANSITGSASAAGTSLENNALLKALFSNNQESPSPSYATTEPVAPYNPAMVSSTGYIDPRINITPNNG